MRAGRRVAQRYQLCGAARSHERRIGDDAKPRNVVSLEGPLARSAVEVEGNECQQRDAQHQSSATQRDLPVPTHASLAMCDSPTAEKSAITVGNPTARPKTFIK
jgi:hypothetical protein